MNDQKVRVRFAPSPTGPLHMGGVRTALYNYLLARQTGGQMILRIEDTDQTRFVPGAEQYIIESLTWCGIQFDEGVHVGGPFGPYRQSDRKEIYVKYADELIANGHAYYAFDTPEELEALRAASPNFQYDSSTRVGLRNSLTLSAEEVSDLLNKAVPYVIRAKIPAGEEILVDDLIRGEVRVQSSVLDDKVLFKSDGMPTYHLANIVDDHLMEITHVIRGEEWLPSAPLHVLLYRFFGWNAPRFAHLPLLLKPDGNGKLSKRDGDRLGFPVFPLRWTDPKSGDVSSGYRESGYFPEAFVNLLALLGWNPGTEQEVFSMDELIGLFSLDRVNKAGAKFDPEKAKWFNQQYLRKLSDQQLTGLFVEQMSHNGVSIDENKALKVIPLVKDRVVFVSELWDQCWFFFQRPAAYDEGVVKKRWKADTGELILCLAERLVALPDFTQSSLEEEIKRFLEEKGVGMGVVMNALRLAMVGSGMGPHLLDIVVLLGKEEFISRVKLAVDSIKVN